MTSHENEARSIANTWTNGNRKDAAARILDPKRNRADVACTALQVRRYLAPADHSALLVVLTANDDPEPAPKWARDDARAILDDLAASNARDVPTGIDFCAVMDLLELLADR